MTLHPALTQGRAAVITGAASGIGLAAATWFAGQGMRVCLADLAGAALEDAAQSVAKAAANGARDVLAVPTDVSKREEVARLRDRAMEAFGEVAVLMNNAGTSPGGTPPGPPWTHPHERSRQVIEVNLWGVIHGIECFTQAMIDQGTPCAIVSTGSKQGITCPPGDTAYNISKAGVKVATEALAHGLRGVSGCQVSAHLLVPGSTFTGMTTSRTKPPGAWMPEQVVEFMLERMAAGDFYIICPDNDVTRETDNKRMEWAMGDIIHNRPPLSRWHADYKEAFAHFLT